MSRNPNSTKIEVRTTIDDMSKINDGFLRHKGLELSEEDLKRVTAAANGEITKEEMLAEVDAKEPLSVP